MKNYFKVMELYYCYLVILWLLNTKNVCKTMLNLEIVFQESIFQLQRDSLEFQWGSIQF